MRLQNVSFGVIPRKNDNNTAFKSRYTFDVGASDPRCSLKILVQDNKGKDLFEYKGFLNDTTNGFKDNNDFIKKVARAVDVETLIDSDIASINNQLAETHIKEKDAEKLTLKLKELQSNKAMLQARSVAERKLTGFALLLPGTMQGQNALFMPNVRDINERSLEDVELRRVIGQIKKQGKVEFADSFNIKKDFIPSKDIAGTGIGIAKKIANHPEYKKRFTKGFFATAVQTGGGFGAADIKLQKNSQVTIETDESGHDLYFDRKTKTGKRLGKLGASTGSVIENFATKLNIKDPTEIKALIKTGLAQLATQEEIKLDSKKDKAAIEVLMNTGFYNISELTPEQATLKIKTSNLAQFKEASAYSVQSYADTLALHAITKINRGSNMYVVSGPLAMGLNSTIKAEPETYGAKNMRELIFKYIDDYVGTDFSCNKMRKGHNFDIVCDESVSIANNTSGGALLLSKNKPSTFARRGEWMSIPTKVLKTIAKA